MKKILFSLLMFCSMTAAWAGNGTGTQKDPYTGYWNANSLISQLKEGDHLAYNCRIEGDFLGGDIFVYDDKLDNANVYKNFQWNVGDLIDSNERYPKYYKNYYSFNSSEDRKNHTFIVTKAESIDGTTINITGHYSGSYSGGDGSKEHPFAGEWTASEIGPKLEPGMYLAYDCVIKDVKLTVIDSKLGQTVAGQWTAWAPGNLIENAKDGPYKEYCEDNTPEDRKSQSFILTDVSPEAKNSFEFTITGYFSGFYSTPDATDGFVYVATTEQLWKAIKANNHAEVRLTQDIALSDINKDYETYCETFYGTIDGDGHTIKGDPEKDVRSRTYMFYKSDGAIFKNLTFKGIRVNSNSDSNQAIITAKAQNGCVFDNITFDNVHTWSDDDNVGSAAGWAQDCTFMNITVKNSDFTVDESQSGCIVGHAIGCTFMNIKVENCESTSAAGPAVLFETSGKSGGVAGRTDDCEIDNVEILGSFIKTYSNSGGGVVGYSEGTHFTNCVVDDQSCVCVDGETINHAKAGGIVGSSNYDKLNNCINSALVAADDHYAGGIVGDCHGSDIEECLNTGMVIDINMDNVINDLYNKYKTKTGLICVTKTYQGKKYVIRKNDRDYSSSSHAHFGGITGNVQNGNVSKCANFGSIYCKSGSSAAGIAACLRAGTISDCLSDYTGDGYGICVLFSTTAKFVNNCLNLTTYKDIAAYDNNWKGFDSNDNNYSLTTAEDAHHTHKTTAAKIKSGEICLKLGENWEQNIGTDAYPTPTGNRGIYHMRVVQQKDYGTICVPFPLEMDYREYYLFNEVKNEADGTVSICFKYTDVVPAGTPAIFRAYVNSDYYFVPMEKEYLFDIKPTVGTEWTFNGTYEQKVFEGEDAKSIYYLDGTVDKSAIKNAKKTTIAPYRAYLSGPNIETLNGSNGAPAKAIRFVIEDEDGETTEIKLADFNENQNFNFNGNFNGKTYSIMGTQVNENYRGIVIKNGKKIICE